MYKFKQTLIRWKGKMEKRHNRMGVGRCLVIILIWMAHLTLGVLGFVYGIALLTMSSFTPMRASRSMMVLEGLVLFIFYPVF